MKRGLGGVLRRYAILMLGEKILLHGSYELPMTGFVLLQVVRAGSEEEAVKLCRVAALQQWKRLFNRDNRSGTPLLKQLKVVRVRNPFKRFAGKGDFCFYADDEQRESLISELGRQF